MEKTSMKSTADAIVVGIAVVLDEGRFLVGTRRVGTVLAGMAEFPGGKCRPDETPRECAVRECREEAALAVEPLELLDVVRHDYDHGRVELHFWKCRLVETTQSTSTPHARQEEFRWVSRAELARLMFPDANAGVVRRLLADAGENL